MLRRVAPPLALVLGAAMLSGCLGHPSAPIVSGGQCLAELDSLNVAYRPVELSEPANGRCHVDTAVKVSRIEVALNQTVTMSCRLAARFDAFERDIVQGLARQDLGRAVVRIDHLGAYSCRRNTGKPGELSEHAFGLAIDISGFRLSDGTEVSVERDWWAPGRKRDFLHHLAQSACEYFSVVLTPTSNRDHYNHMHFDIGPSRLCSV